MDNQLVIRGVPASIARDAWWFLDEDAGGTKAATGPTANGKATHMPPKAMAALAMLVVLADVMFWDTDLGISVALYAMALSVCMIALKPGGVTRREAATALGLVTLCTLPVVEQVSPLSLAFSSLGILGLLVWITLGTKADIARTVKLLIEATFIGPVNLPFEAAQELRGATSRVDAITILRTTALPLGIGAVFLLLFSLANPLVESALESVSAIGLFSAEQWARLIFWGVTACLIWPYLNPKGRWCFADKTEAHVPAPLHLPFMGLVNGRSVLVSLALFNVMFGLQTLSDLGVLTGGMALPDGMTYAEYAHRGAYPLMVTAAVSGLFAVATRRMVADNTLMRRLMYLWLGQNLFLVLTAAVRLGLYVDAYGLTYLRVAAFIWMGLVFVALVLIVVQMIQKRPFTWLVRGNAVAVTGTLYLCCFINFAYLITDYNMTHTPPGALDLAYLCALGEQVIPAMMDFGQATDQTACGRGAYPAIRFDPIEDWQEWGFRRWRLQRYLETYHDL